MILSQGKEVRMLIVEFLDGVVLPLFDSEKDEAFNTLLEQAIKAEARKRKAVGKSDVVKIRILQSGENAITKELSNAA
jgi:hypothetical protein